MPPRLVQESFPGDPEGCPLGRIVDAAVLPRSSGVGPGYRDYPHFALVLTLRGSGLYHDTSGENAPLRPGSMIYVQPGLSHRYQPERDRSDWSQFYISFTGPLFEAWRSGGLFGNSSPVTEVGPVDYWRSRMREVCLAPTGSMGATLRRVCLLQLLLADLRDHVTRSNLSNRDAAFLERAQLLLAADLNQQLSYEELSRTLGVSYESFRKRFRMLTGVSPHQYRLQLRTDRATESLLSTDAPLAEIADQCGFGTEFYFSRIYRKRTGRAPSELRRGSAGRRP